MQVDHMSKCVPQDWFLGYDQFSLYTFLNLNGRNEGQSGFLRTLIRPIKISNINIFNQLEKFEIQFDKMFAKINPF